MFYSANCDTYDGGEPAYLGALAGPTKAPGAAVKKAVAMAAATKQGATATQATAAAAKALAAAAQAQAQKKALEVQKKDAIARAAAATAQAQQLKTQQAQAQAQKVKLTADAAQKLKAAAAKQLQKKKFALWAEQAENKGNRIKLDLAKEDTERMRIQGRTDRSLIDQVPDIVAAQAAQAIANPQQQAPFIIGPGADFAPEYEDGGGGQPTTDDGAYEGGGQEQAFDPADAATDPYAGSDDGYGDGAGVELAPPRAAMRPGPMDLVADAYDAPGVESDPYGYDRPYDDAPVDQGADDYYDAGGDGEDFNDGGGVEGLGFLGIRRPRRRRPKRVKPNPPGARRPGAHLGYYGEGDGLGFFFIPLIIAAASAAASVAAAKKQADAQKKAAKLAAQAQTSVADTQAKADQDASRAAARGNLLAAAAQVGAQRAASSAGGPQVITIPRPARPSTSGGLSSITSNPTTLALIGGGVLAGGLMLSRNRSNSRARR